MSLFSLCVKGLVALMENHQLVWRLILVENWDNKNYKKQV